MPAFHDGKLFFFSHPDVSNQKRLWQKILHFSFVKGALACLCLEDLRKGRLLIAGKMPERNSHKDINTNTANAIVIVIIKNMIVVPPL